MTGGVFGGGVIFVVAAVLWTAVLVPAWVRRREFKAAEQNAVRLQRTLRVLAETAEVPTEVRVEATARAALAQERLLKTAQRRQEAERQAELAAARAEQVRAEIRAQQTRRTQGALKRAARLRRPLVRRLRGIAALVALLSMAGLLVGLGFLAAGQGFVVLAIAALAAVASLGALVLMAPGRVKVVEIAAEQMLPAPVETAPVERVEAPTATETSAELHAAAQAVAAERIERARAMARARAQRPAGMTMRNQPDSILLEEARRQVRDEQRAATGARAPEQALSAGSAAAVAPEAMDARVAATEPRGAARPQRVPAPATADRLRGMGVVGDTSDGALDLDAVLRARRAAG